MYNENLMGRRATRKDKRSARKRRRRRAQTNEDAATYEMVSHEAEELLLRLESTLDLDKAVTEARVNIHKV